ncbi:hypothetical protein O0L34_g11801 [Tuta absoluta]|nr:hypothetical protein O0L34_g11801 [Tuta absoluta]
MSTKLDLKNKLEEICPSVKFIRFDYASPEKFRIELKCQVEKDQTMEFYIDFIKNWITKFSKFTASGWIVRHTFSKMKRLVFRKIFTCQRSSFNKKKVVSKETRNQECRAKIDFKIKFINKNTMKNDKDLKEGLNLNIFIDFVHSHKVRTAESYQLLRKMPETEESFQKYFEMGCIVAAVKKYYELTLIDKYGDNCHEVFENAIMNPSMSQLFYLQKKKNIKPLSTREALEKKRESVKDSEVDIVLSDNDTETCLIVTPVMKRFITEIGLEHVLVDSTDVPNGATATFILVPTSIGAMLVACVLHGKYDLNNALQLTKSHMETLTGQKFSPKVLEIDNFDAYVVLPSQKTIASRYFVCNEIWRWINNDDNKIERKKRHRIMLAIKPLLYAESPETAEKINTELQNNDNVVAHPSLKEYLKVLWDKKEQWMFHDNPFRNNNLIDLSIRFLKEFITLCCKSFNEPLMVEFITNILENHFKRIIASYVKKSMSVATYTKYLNKAGVVLNFGSEVRRISSNEFRVETQAKTKKYINFRTDTMCCNCSQGRKGHFCIHLSAIVNVVDCDVMKSPILTEEEKNMYNRITGGDVEDEIKPEINAFKIDIDDFGRSDDFNEDYDNDGEIQSASSSPKEETYNVNEDDFLVEVKTEKLDRFDPLDESIEQEILIPTDSVTAQTIPIVLPATSKGSDMKATYETVLKAVNDEFRRLNRFFSENPNNSNLETMKRLARELSKIRPMEKISLENIILKPNRKRKFDTDCKGYLTVTY